MFRELIEEKRDAVIILCKEAEEQAMRSTLSGWTIDVVIDKDGNVWLEGPRSSGTQTVQEWEGNALCIYSAKCGQFDIDYMLDCVNWPDSMIDFVEHHKITGENAEDIAAYDLWIDGEHMFFDTQMPREVELDFIEEYASSLDYESKIFVE
jgi:hypothetical protein